MSERRKNYSRNARVPDVGTGKPGVFIRDSIRASTAYKSLSTSARLTLIDMIAAYGAATKWGKRSINGIGFTYAWGQGLEMIGRTAHYQNVKQILEAGFFRICEVGMHIGECTRFFLSTDWEKFAERFPKIAHDVQRRESRQQNTRRRDKKRLIDRTAKLKSSAGKRQVVSAGKRQVETKIEPVSSAGKRQDATPKDDISQCRKTAGYDQLPVCLREPGRYPATLSLERQNRLHAVCKRVRAQRTLQPTQTPVIFPLWPQFGTLISEMAGLRRRQSCV